MAYSAQTDILGQIDETTLLQLTDDDNAGIIDSVKVERAIADADATIDSYCQGKYTTPLSPVPPKIRQISVDIAIYNLYSRKVSEAPKIRDDRNKEAIRYLEKVAAGAISLGADTPAEVSDGQAQASHTKTDRVFTMGKTSDGSAGSLDNY